MIALNHVFKMDNLELLKQMDDESVDLIYCDILYNTGKKFDDFSDRLGTPKEAIEWYMPRLQEMKRILKSTGNIYLQMDYRLVHYMKVAMDEVFGEQNFKNEIVWEYNSAPRKKGAFGNRHDTILRYAKNSKATFFNDESEHVREPYSETAPRGYAKEKYYNPLGKVRGDVWRIKMIAQNDKTERVGYSTQKPLELLYPIVSSSCPSGGVFADFFCGSGTSLVVAKELGMQYIGCDINEKAVNISNLRLNQLDSEVKPNEKIFV